MKIGFIGLGRMGSGMAQRLIAAGHDLLVFDPSEAQATLVAGYGATRAGDLPGVCQGREVVISMLPSDPILEAAALEPGGLVASLPPGAIHMVSGTHGVGAIDRLAAAHAAAGQVLVSCSVLGRPDRAAEGKLGLIPAGPQAAVEKLQPVLTALGERIFEPGEQQLSGVVMKIANNFLLGCAIEAMGEAMALVRRYDVDPELFYQVVSEGLFDCIAYRAYGDVIAKQDWGRVGASVTIGLKDANLAMEAAERRHVPLPSGNVWRDNLLAAMAHGEDALDWSVMARQIFRATRLED